jgi:uncharacterized protein (TIGR03118 family)
MMKRLLGVALALGFVGQANAGERFAIKNLVTDDPSANSAAITDPALKNAWGISFTPGGSPFWVSDNATGVATLYSVNPLTDAVTKNALVVTIPGNGSVTGQVANDNRAGGAFNADNFLFVSEDGTVSGWRGALGTTAEVLRAGSNDNVYKGVAETTISGNSYLYAANFRAGTIDVIKGTVGAPNLAGSFIDPTIPAGFAPFNIQLLNGKLYVTYALQDNKAHDDVAGAGNGFVSVFDLQGNFLHRVGSGGPLDSPWGLAIAPTSFGNYGGDLLVGNFGDGHINIYDLNTFSYVGQLAGVDSNPIVIDGLWALSVGSGLGNSGSNQRLYFTAGPNEETNGLFGVISSVPEPSTIISCSLAGVIGLIIAQHRRKIA